MIRKSIILSFVLLTMGFSLAAQQLWSLEGCIQYAMENNIQIKQSVLNTEYNENLLKRSKLGQIPSLSGSTNYTYSWGRALDQTTYQFTDNQQINSISMGLSSYTNLFNGLQVRNTILQNKLNLMASYEDVQKVKNDISLNIAAAYLTIMFNKELLAVTKNQLEITGQQVERTRKMVDAGKLARGNSLELQAQFASEELNLVNAENQLSISLLNLQQTLDLPIDTAFDVVIPELADPDEDPLVVDALEVYRIAEQEMPEIKSAMLSLESAEKGLAIAKGGRSPQLYLSANFNTGYSDIREQVVNLSDPVQLPIGITAGGETVYTIDPQQIPEYGAYPFFEQMRDNTSTGVGLGLSIPIFNGWNVNTNIANARIMHENAQFDLQSKKLILYATIQQAYADALAALKKFNATQQALTSMEESFKYTEKKFEVGLVNTVDYNMSKNQLIATQSDLLQAKYDFIFRTKILNFYQGEPITL
ncbi:MAG: TolC family protein [Bacteroidales bacterium]|nr:TolC family protein [Bacteroidales bacterium]